MRAIGVVLAAAAVACAAAQQSEGATPAQFSFPVQVGSENFTASFTSNDNIYGVARSIASQLNLTQNADTYDFTLRKLVFAAQAAAGQPGDAYINNPDVNVTFTMPVEIEAGRQVNLVVLGDEGAQQAAEGFCLRHGLDVSLAPQITAALMRTSTPADQAYELFSFDLIYNSTNLGRVGFLSTYVGQEAQVALEAYLSAGLEESLAVSLANEVAPQLEQLVNNLGPERQLAVERTMTQYRSNLLAAGRVLDSVRKTTIPDPSATSHSIDIAIAGELYRLNLTPGTSITTLAGHICTEQLPVLAAVMEEFASAPESVTQESCIAALTERFNAQVSA